MGEGWGCETLFDKVGIGVGQNSGMDTADIERRIFLTKIDVRLL